MEPSSVITEQFKVINYQTHLCVPCHLIAQLSVLAHEVDREGVMILPSEHVRSAGLPEERVASRHADGVPEVNNINPTSLG